MGSVEPPARLIDGLPAVAILWSPRATLYALRYRLDGGPAPIRQRARQGAGNGRIEAANLPPVEGPMRGTMADVISGDGHDLIAVCSAILQSRSLPDCIG